MIRLGSEIVVSVNDHQWRLVSNLRDAGPADAVFTLDSQNGSIRFGNGVQGAKPPVGSTITVSYRQGTGSSGNISKKIHDATDLMKFGSSCATALRFWVGETDVIFGASDLDNDVHRSAAQTLTAAAT